MTTISRTSLEAMTKALVTGPRSIPLTGVNLVHQFKTKQVEMTAEEKAKFLQRQAASDAGAAEMAKLEALRQGPGPAAATYTKFGKMSTEEEKTAFVQWSLDQFDKGEALYEKRRQEIEKNNTAVSTAGQSGNAATPPLEQYLYKESREMYLSNISTLSLDHAKTQLGIVEVKIKNREDVGVNVHGRYEDQKISDLSTYLAALKDYISKFEISVSPASSEAATRTALTGE